MKPQTSHKLFFLTFSKRVTASQKKAARYPAMPDVPSHSRTPTFLSEPIDVRARDCAYKHKNKKPNVYTNKKRVYNIQIQTAAKVRVVAGFRPAHFPFGVLLGSPDIISL